MATSCAGGGKSISRITGNRSRQASAKLRFTAAGMAFEQHRFPEVLAITECLPLLVADVEIVFRRFGKTPGAERRRSRRHCFRRSKCRNADRRSCFAALVFAFQ